MKKKKALTIIAALTKKRIQLAADSICTGWTYQPPIPKELEKYKK